MNRCLFAPPIKHLSGRYVPGYAGTYFFMDLIWVLSTW